MPAKPLKIAGITCFLIMGVFHVLMVDFESTAVGLRVKDGVVLGAEKIILSKMLVEGSNKRIAHIDRHVGFVRRFSLPNISSLRCN